MELINLTEHAVTLLEPVDASDASEPAILKTWDGCASADVARVETVDTECVPIFLSGEAALTVPVVMVQLTDVVNLPPAEYGKGYIVSTLVREANKHRKDLFSPYPAYRDSKGRIRGCFGFAVNA